MMRQFASFDIGGTNIKYSLINEDASFLFKGSMPTMAERGPYIWMEDIVNKVEEMKRMTLISGIAISSTAMIDSDKGKVLFSLPQVPNYTGFPIKEYLEKRCSLPVEVENDCNSACLAESISGSGKGYKTTLLLTIGTGIGAGFTLDGKLLKGNTYSALEVGYIPLGKETLEDLGSTSSLIRRVNKKKNTTSLNGLDIIKLAKEKDEDALKEIKVMTDSIAYGLKVLSYILNPHVIVLGGAIMSNDFILEEIGKKYIEITPSHIALNTPIKRAYYSNDAGMIGALYNYIEKHPLL